MCTCRVLFSQVTWRRQDQDYPLMVETHRFINDARFDVDVVHRLGEWNLVIDDVRPSDEGVYLCSVVTHAHNDLTFNVTLHVKSE